MEDLKKGDANELMITKFKKKGKKLKAQKTYCFKRVNPEKAEYGWCKTVGKYQNLIPFHLLRDFIKGTTIISTSQRMISPAGVTAARTASWMRTLTSSE